MLEEELERMAPDLGVIEEWKRKDASYVQRLADLETATATRNEVSPSPTVPLAHPMGVVHLSGQSGHCRSTILRVSLHLICHLGM